MRAECAQAVVKAIGRSLNKAELDGIEERITRAMRAIRNKDQQAWAAKPLHERVQEGAQAAAQELVGEQVLKQQRASLTVNARARIQQHLTDQAGRGVDKLDSLDRMNTFHADSKGNFVSLEKQAQAIEFDGLRQMLGTLEASNPKWFGLFENQKGVESVVRAIFGEKTGVSEADAGAKEWQTVTSALRERFNRAGGDVGELDDWGMPHHHSQSKVALAGRDQWVKDILPHLGSDSYFNPDGTRMTDPQLHDFLKEAWTTIATGGANKLDPGQFAGGMRANRGNASRQIHFKDADAYMDYQSKYGDKSLYEVLVGHIEGISKDIALTETYGPNPDQTFRLLRDEAVRDAKLADPAKVHKIDARAINTENLYNVVAGKTQPVASRWLATTFDTLRNWLIASRLGSSIVTSFSDEATLHLTARINHLPEMQLIRNELAAMNPANRMEERMAMRAGLSLNTMKSSLNRFGQQGLGKSFSSKLANSVIRIQGLNAITEARKRGFGVTMMGAIGSVAREHATLTDLDKQDHRMLLSKGIHEDDFQVWKKAQQEDWGGGNDSMLTPESIYRIPDADIDKVIAPRVQKLKDQADASIKDLKSRDAQDQKWVQARADKLSQWLKAEQAKVEKFGAKADAEGGAKLKDIAARISKLNETLEFATSMWKKPADVDMPGIENQRTVGFYGKAKLRDLGVDEGKAREAIRNVASQARDITVDMRRMKMDATEKLFDEFYQRQDELKEFTQRSQERVDRRAKVADRLQKEIDPAIADERMKAREQAVTKLLGAILEETDTAVIEPGAKERAFTGAGLQRGTWKGELTRSFFLFKSFPLAMITRHWNRGMSLPNKGGRAAYLATLFAATTVLGAVSLQVNELLAGRDPKNLNPFGGKSGVRNWIQAMLKGGSLGIYGDFLFSDTSQYGNSPIASATGPVLSLAEDLFNITQGNVVKSLLDKKTHMGAQVVRFVKSNTPGASLWYLKAAMDHLIYNQLSEYFSPGYLARMRARAQNEFGQRYWWEPQDVTPSRAPDLTSAAQ